MKIIGYCLDRKRDHYADCWENNLTDYVPYDMGFAPDHSQSLHVTRYDEFWLYRSLVYNTVEAALVACEIAQRGDIYHDEYRVLTLVDALPEPEYS